MSIGVGTQLGSLEITAPLGKGGMGEVYRARDAKLKRDVAIKILPDEFSRDPDRVSRFQREAEVLASLNHPSIAAIYDLQEASGLRYLVLELVDGDTLQERLKRGPIPVAEALPIAKQIAEALEAAHEKGIIHRDLKPANIKITASGAVKVLDFGLAKTFRERQESSASDSPTLISDSVGGVILGTAAYMSPEQAKGRTADKRSDVWAFGTVLYEILTGRRAFEGDEVSDTLAAVLKSDPDWSLLPADTPSTIRTLVEHCLRKDRKQRIADIAVAQFLLNAPAPVSPVIGVSRRARALVTASLAIAVLAIMAAVWLGIRQSPAPPRPVTRFAHTFPADVSLLLNQGNPAIALSPDGTRLVYTARVGSGNLQMLYSRATDQIDAIPIRGSEGGKHPFFSPDGQWIGFNSLSGKLEKVAVGGGAVVTLCDAGLMRGATWLPDDSIIFRPGTSAGLWRVSASGGMPQEMLKPDSKSEAEFRWPEVLPGGKAILFTIERNNFDLNRHAIGALRLDTRERLVLVEGGMNPHYFSSGHLVFARDGEILAVPFDVKTLQLRGSPVRVIEGVLTNILQGPAQLTASFEGSIAFVPGSEAQDSRRLVWVDRRGTVQPLAAPKRNYEFPRLSPDGQQVAVRIAGGSDPGNDLWLYQFARGTLSRFTSKLNDPETPVWTPDGKRLAFAMNATNQARQIVWKLVDGSAGEEVLAGSERHLHLGGLSPKGDALVAMASEGGIWTLEITDKRTLRELLRTPYLKQAPTISPNGRWLAYATNDTNRFEVYVQPFPNLNGKYQISTDGGAEPIWAKNGRELFYRNGDKMMAVAIGEKGDRLELGTPTLLFEGRFAVAALSSGDAWYDVSPDGRRFLMLKTEDAPGTTNIIIVQNWINELKRLVPTK